MNEVKRPKKPLIVFYTTVLVLLLAFNLFILPALVQGSVKEVDYGTFMTATEKGQIDEVQIDSHQILYTLKGEKTVYKTGLMNDPGLTERLYKSGATFSQEIVEEASPLMTLVLSWLLPMGIFLLLGNLISKKLMNKAGGGPGSMMFNLGKSNAKVYVKSSDGIRFSDVEGVDEAEENLQEIVDYLHDPKKYSEIGASMPKGILLVGPPGTGKTMLAKAVAGEANVPFFSMSGSEFVEMFVGMGASKVRDLFSQAKEKAPCIVFIDEIDAIGKKREGQVGGNDEREQTLNQLLTEMDGFEGNNGVIILAATNRPESLDPALTRPGRFDRRVPVELPDLKGREAILKVHSKKVRMSDGVDFEKIAIDKDEEAKTITIDIPDSEIFSVNIDKDTFKIYSEKDSLWNPVKLEDYNSSLAKFEESAKEKALQNGILEKSDAQAKTLIENFMHSLPETSKYQIVIK